MRKKFNCFIPIYFYHPNSCIKIILHSVCLPLPLLFMASALKVTFYLPIYIEFPLFLIVCHLMFIFWQALKSFSPFGHAFKALILNIKPRLFLPNKIQRLWLYGEISFLFPRCCMKIERPVMKRLSIGVYFCVCWSPWVNISYFFLSLSKNLGAMMPFGTVHL